MRSWPPRPDQPGPARWRRLAPPLTPRGAAQHTGPPLQRPGCCASLRDGPAGRPGPRSLCVPWRQETTGRPQACPRARARHPGSRLPPRMVDTERGHLPAALQRPIEPGDGGIFGPNWPGSWNWPELAAIMHAARGSPCPPMSVAEDQSCWSARCGSDGSRRSPKCLMMSSTARPSVSGRNQHTRAGCSSRIVRSSSVPDSTISRSLPLLRFRLRRPAGLTCYPGSSPAAAGRASGSPWPPPPGPPGIAGPGFPTGATSALSRQGG